MIETGPVSDSLAGSGTGPRSLSSSTLAVRNPVSPLSPCQRAGIAGPLLPALLVSMPGIACTAAPRPSVSLALHCLRLRPPTRSCSWRWSSDAAFQLKATDAWPLSNPVWHWPPRAMIHCLHLLCALFIWNLGTPEFIYEFMKYMNSYMKKSYEFIGYMNSHMNSYI